jgi:alkanesulfonate monooxygenase SsuD/methylene tetrahydromethanopterin reductase-like flavin-dependent oxidoreductase (luciferase family)
MAERVPAMRRIWTEDVEFHGEHVDSVRFGRGRRLASTPPADFLVAGAGLPRRSKAESSSSLTSG